MLFRSVVDAINLECYIHSEDDLPKEEEEEENEDEEQGTSVDLEELLNGLGTNSSD